MQSFDIVKLNREQFVKWASWWNEDNGLLGFYLRRVFAVAVRHIENAHIEKIALLDIGCGTGGLCRAVRAKFPNAKIIGIDSTPEMINAARTFEKDTSFVKDTSIEYRVADAHSLPFADQTFNVVAILETLHHVENPACVIAEVHRVLAIGGLLIIYDPENSGIIKSTLVKIGMTLFGESYACPVSRSKMFQILQENGLLLQKTYSKWLFMQWYVIAKRT